MLKYVTRTPSAKPTQRLIVWYQTVQRPGTTALISTKREVRPGMFITHNVHGKVKLLAESVPNELKDFFRPPQAAEEFLGDFLRPPVAADDF